MYSNIGKKIKAVAVINAVLGMIASIVIGASVISSADNSYIIDDDFGIAVGIITIIFGIIGSWVLSFCLYGFGRLIENSEDIANYLRNNGKIVVQQSVVDSEAFKAAKEKGIELTKTAYEKGTKIVSDTAQKIANKTANKAQTINPAYPQQGVPVQTNPVQAVPRQAVPTQTAPAQNISYQTPTAPKPQNRFCTKCGMPIGQCVCGVKSNTGSGAAFDDVFSNSTTPSNAAEDTKNNNDLDDFFKEFGL